MPHLDGQLAAFADGGDVHVAVQHFDVGIGFDLPAQNFAGRVGFEAHGAHALAHHLEGNLLQVEDDIGGVFDHAGNGAEFVRHAFDPHGGDGRAFNRAQQHAPQARADGGSESALERLRGEHAVPVGERFRVGDQPLGFLKSFKHR